jgi:uroporphyrin-III C-methyltransferase
MSAKVAALGADARAGLLRAADTLALPRLQAGWVWLAGAGPGDPGLASLHTLTAIADADIIFLDALVNRALLKLARPDAEIIDSGKRGGRPSPTQDFISRRLILAARRGRKVLRLKGGDPFVFGRGGEEALALVRAGVPFRVVPGVTAGIGGLAYAGIPVTHRDVNQAVTFVTGSGTNGRAPDLDWAAIARGSPTIVLYMARKYAGEIAGKLIAAGRDPNEPAAIISSASLDQQTTMVTTLAGLGLKAAEAQTPAILVIGENVKLASGLDWLGAATQGRVLDPDPLRRSPLSEAG